MKCKHCGHEAPDGAVACLSCGKLLKKKEPSGAARVVLGILTVLLSLALAATLLSTALVADYRQLTKQDSIKSMVSSALGLVPKKAPIRPMPAAAGVTPERAQGDLAGWIQEGLEQALGQEVSREQVEAVLEQSTVDEFLTDEISAYVGDFLNGTNEANITAGELKSLLEENAALLERELGLPMTDDFIDIVVEEIQRQDLNTFIRDEVMQPISDAVILEAATVDAVDYTVSMALAVLRAVTSQAALYTLIGMDLLLIVLLFFANRMSICGTLVSVGVPATVVGGLLSIPTGLLGMLPSMGDSETGAFVDTLVNGFVGATAPIHGGILAAGVVLLVAAIVVAALKKKDSTLPYPTDSAGIS